MVLWIHFKNIKYLPYIYLETRIKKPWYLTFVLSNLKEMKYMDYIWYNLDHDLIFLLNLKRYMWFIMYFLLFFLHWKFFVAKINNKIVTISCYGGYICFMCVNSNDDCSLSPVFLLWARLWSRDWIMSSFNLYHTPIREVLFAPFDDEGFEA